MKDPILEELIARRQRTRNACNRMTEKLKHAPPGRLRIVTRKGKRGAIWYQYYVSYTEGDTNGKYLPKSEAGTAAAIAQRDYERALLEHKRMVLTFLDKTISGFVSEDAQSVYDALLPARRLLVTPENAPTSEQAIAAWKKKRYKSNPFPEKPTRMTAAGVLVRSKSEALIADALHQAGFPFRYEYPVRLAPDTLYYADFFILNPATGREFVWEHFGRMDESNYCGRAIKKISDYTCFMMKATRSQKDATPFGFLMTFEDKENPLQSWQIEAQLALIRG